MQMFHDTFLLAVTVGTIPASIEVPVEYKRNEYSVGDPFAVGFVYTTGRPRAVADFELEWSTEAGRALTGVGATPTNVVINPVAPRHTKTVQGKSVDVGFSEQQDGLITGICQIVESVVQGKIIITQPN